MPELPEVETIKLGLQKYVIGHKIIDVEIKAPNIFEGDKKDIIGAKIKAIRRIGKGLIIDLDNDYSLAIHIKLTGQLVFRDDKTKNIPISKEKVGSIPNKFTHIVFYLDKNAKLYYNDQRRFGWIRVVKTKDIMDMKFFKTMGPEPFGYGEGPALTIEMFKNILRGRTTKIKPLIMDQEKIGGIGNIYANDALFEAKIDPKKSSKSLTDKEVEKLFESIHNVMEKGFKYGGASEMTFVNVLGQTGEYQRYSLVYGKNNSMCAECKGKIEFEKIAGRGTYYCPNCQV